MTKNKSQEIIEVAEMESSVFSHVAGTRLHKPYLIAHINQGTTGLNIVTLELGVSEVMLQKGFSPQGKNENIVDCSYQFSTQFKGRLIYNNMIFLVSNRVHLDQNIELGFYILTKSRATI